MYPAYRRKAMQIVDKVFVFVNSGRPRADAPTSLRCFVGDAALGVPLGITIYPTFSTDCIAVRHAYYSLGTAP